MRFTNDELKSILDSHKKWLNSRTEEESRANLRKADLWGASLSKANLSEANLRGADLREANLSKADLQGANLSKADLQGAYLQGADLWEANLRGANLWGANLSKANLWGADLREANLQGADLRGADLRGANLDASINTVVPLVCPEYGSFIAWKKALCLKKEKKVLIKLQIPEDAKRSSATGRKCRASKALVLDIFALDNPDEKFQCACSKFDLTFEYEVGKTVEVKDFDENRFNECAPGIHFFITKQEAIDY